MKYVLLTDKVFDKTQDAREYRELCRRINVCVRCRTKDAYTIAGRNLCYECSQKNKEYSKKRYAENKQQYLQKQIERSAKLEEKKLCIVCGKPNKSKFKSCATCRAKRRAKYAQTVAYKDKSKCEWCENPVVPEKHLCAECLEIKRKILRDATKDVDRTKHPWRTKTKGEKLNASTDELQKT